MSKKSRKPHFNVAGDVQVALPRSETAFPIPTSDWDFLKHKIERLSPPPIVFNTIGSGLLGVSASAVVAALTLHEGTSERDTVVSWSIFLVTLLPGILSLFFHYLTTKNFSSTHKQAILDQMQHMEGKFQR